MTAGRQETLRYSSEAGIARLWCNHLIGRLYNNDRGRLRLWVQAASRMLPFLLAFLPIQPVYPLAVNTSSVLYEPVIALSAALNLTITDPPGACKDLDTCRSLFSIVQTCLATIFACVWVAVHRNIPVPRTEPKYSSNPVKKAAQWLWSKICDQRQSVIVVVVTLLVPEWVLAWAIRQAIRARKLAKELEDARKDATELWEKSLVEHAVERGAETIGEEGNRSAGLSLRPSSDDKLPLLEKQSASNGTSISRAMHPEDRLACTSLDAARQYGLLTRVANRDPCQALREIEPRYACFGTCNPPCSQ